MGRGGYSGGSSIIRTGTSVKGGMPGKTRFRMKKSKRLSGKPIPRLKTSEDARRAGLTQKEWRKRTAKILQSCRDRLSKTTDPSAELLAQLTEAEEDYQAAMRAEPISGSASGPGRRKKLVPDKPVLTERFDEALVYASKLHRLQTRKGTEIPYISHLLGVASLAIEAGADEDQAIAALLHDAVEDQGGAPQLEEIRRRFGNRVAAIVDHCTDADTIPKPPWRERKEIYIDGLSHKPTESLLVSLADKTHNAGAILADLIADGETVWERFTGGKDGTLWYYASLSEAFCVHLPGAAAERLKRIVLEIHGRAEGDID